MLLYLVSIACAVEDWRSRLWHGHHYRHWPTYSDSIALLDEWQAQYPALLRKETFGKSFQKRDLLVYVMTDSASTQPKDQVLITALLHGREPAGLDALLYYIGSILENSTRSDPEAIYTLQRKEIWAVPCWNPDAYIENESNGHMIRKNRRPTCPQNEQNGGVDLNRNFGKHWRKKFDGCDEEYQGTAAFSEPETQAIKELVEKHNFKVAYHYHSYGEMLTHPYNYINGPVTNEMPKDDQTVYHEINKVFQYKKFGTAYETVKYSADGESDDWFYSAHNIISLSPELGPEEEEFWPHQKTISGINERSFRRTGYVVYKSGCEPDVSQTRNDSKVTFRVKNAGVSACPLQKLAFSTGETSEVLDVPEIARRGETSLHSEATMVHEFCLSEVGSSICICDPIGPGTGKWTNSADNELCATLIERQSGDSKEPVAPGSPAPLTHKPTAPAVPIPTPITPTHKPEEQPRPDVPRMPPGIFDDIVFDPPPGRVIAVIFCVLAGLLCCNIHRLIHNWRNTETILQPVDNGEDIQDTFTIV